MLQDIAISPEHVVDCCGKKTTFNALESIRNWNAVEMVLFLQTMQV